MDFPDYACFMLKQIPDALFVRRPLLDHRTLMPAGASFSILPTAASFFSPPRSLLQIAAWGSLAWYLAVVSVCALGYVQM